MKLNKFQVAQRCARAIGGGEPVTRSSFRIRALRIHLRTATRRQQRRFCRIRGHMAFVFNENAGDAITVNHEISKETEWRDRHVGVRLNSGEERIDNDFSGKAAVAVNNAREAMTALAR